MSDTTPPICDYEGSSYRTDFWEGKGRDYEDMVERIAINRLLPFSGGRRLLEVGAGFGRLTNMYHAYEQVVVLDYSFSQIQYAQEHHGRQRRYVYVAADVYNLPFRAGVFDGATMVRVIHHMRDAELALSQVRRVMAPGGAFVLEHANKRNLKAMLRYALQRQDWSPYTLEPHEFVTLNIDFHPTDMLTKTRAAGFEVVKRIPVSFFRLGALKNNLPIGLLTTLDDWLQQTTWFYTPSIFMQTVALGEGENQVDIPLDDPDSLFAAPGTGNPLRREGDTMVDTVTGLRWAVRDGIYDFKQPI
jgi:SAM-dependent methyltransferase